jgi:hypothetical protein
MSFSVSIDQEYYIRRINNWYVDMNSNTLYGETQLFGLNFDTRVNGPIVAFVDNHLMAKIDCKLYAFVLGKVEETKKQYKMLYYNYFITKVPNLNIVI